jgi:nitrile hydratase
MSAHDHEHHDGKAHDHDHAAHAANEDDDLELTELEARFIALKSILVERGVVTADEIRHRLELNDQRTPHNGARMIARAWVDPDYKQRMLADAKAAALELGLEVTEGGLVAVENTADQHNMIVCTLCSCYPRSILGEPPAFYFSRAYRSRAAREPRKVLREFGLELPEGVKVLVHDSNADVRYIVLPARPHGTEHLDEEQLTALVSRDCLVGCALPRSSATG